MVKPRGYRKMHLTFIPLVTLKIRKHRYTHSSTDLMIAICTLVVAAAALLAATPVGGSVCTHEFDYIAWAASQTFQVGDTLMFDHGATSSTDDATICVAINPTNSRGKTLTLSAAGSWHFICPNGQALEIKVSAATTTATSPSPPASTADHHTPNPRFDLVWKVVTSTLYYLAWTPVKVIGWALYYLTWTPVKVIVWALYYLAWASWYIILSILYHFLWTPAKVLCQGLCYVAWSVVTWILYYLAWTPSKAVGSGFYYVAWGAWKVVFGTWCFFAFVFLEALMKPVIGECFEAIKGRCVELLLPVIQQTFEAWIRDLYEKLTDG